MIFTKKKKYIALSLCALFALIIGCNTEDLDNLGKAGITLSPDLVIPLGEEDISIGELLSQFQEDSEDNGLGIDTNVSTQELFFSYADTFEFTSTTELIDLSTNITENDTVDDDLTPIEAALAAPGVTVIDLDTATAIPSALKTYSDSIEFSTSTSDATSERIDTIEFSAGTIQINIAENGYDFSVDQFQVDIPKLLTGSTPYSELVTSLPLTINLAGKTAVLDQTADGKSVLGYTVTLKRVSDNTPSSPTDRLIFGWQVSGLTTSVVRGFFGTSAITTTASVVEFDALDDFADAGIQVSGVQTTLDITNGFGVPVEMDFSQFLVTYDNAALNTNLGTALSSSSGGATIDGTKGTIPSAISTSTASTSQFVFSGSNMDQIINDIPNQFTSPSQADPNPDAMAPYTNVHNFFQDGSTLRIIAKVEMPLEVTVSNYVIDTLDFEVDLSDIADSATKIVVGIRADNGLPFNANAAIFVDSVFSDTLNNDNVVVFNQATASGSTLTQKEIGLTDPAKIRQLFDADRAQVILSIDTDGAAIPITQDMGISIKLYLRGEFVIKEDL